ncbi:MAG: hypothetical protein ACI8Z5_000163 [Lentimonas sp.]|jgi:hypothetical protein
MKRPLLLSFRVKCGICVATVFGGSGLRLAMHAIREDTRSDDELDEIQALIEARK